MTGTSVLGITFKDGVMLAADTLGAALPPRARRPLPRASASGIHGAGSPAFPTKIEVVFVLRIGAHIICACGAF